MSASGGFLSRWSRRKLDPRSAPEPDLPVHADAPASSDSPQAQGELSEEEIAALPPVSNLTANSDLSQFLRAGVPASLRREALRRMWSIDPAIRDFVGEARDYSYDWNVPGGVPVSGPLLPGDAPEATLARMFSRLQSDGPEPEAAAEAEPLESASSAGPDDPTPDDAAPVQALPAPAPAVETLPDIAEPAAASRPDVMGTGLAPAREFARVDLPRTPASGAAHRSRRHGAAIPKLD